MTRVLVTRDDGSVIWNEGVNADDFATKHFRLALADRLGWAVADAACAVTPPSFAAIEETGKPEPSAEPSTERSAEPATERSAERSSSSERLLAGAI